MSTDERELLLELSQPPKQVVQMLARLPGDLLMLGAGGKIGHALTLMAKRALDEAGAKNRVIAVSRFSSPQVRQAFENDGITTISCDLGDGDAVKKLPDASDIIYLAGQKFGTSSGAQGMTWLMNTYVPAIVAQRWRDSRIAVYSSGNVYPFHPVESKGPDETIDPAPIGEYAQSVLGRERIFEHYSRTFGTKVVTLRLNYAQEPRYGVMVDIATTMTQGKPVDLTMGYFNALWQGDCNWATLLSLSIAASPPKILNLAGPKVSVREVATKFGKLLGIEPTFTGKEAANALLNDGDLCWKLFGPMTLDVDAMIQRIAAWIKAGQTTWNKPTHFEVRDGKF